MNYKRFRKGSEYNAEKRNKMNNYTYLNENYCQKNQTVLAGDSITELYNHTELFEEYSKLTGTSVYNRGISGDTSDRLLERFESNILNIEPKNIVMLIGTNDLGLGADIEYIKENIKKIILLTKQKLPEINFVLIGVFPINNKISNQGKRKNKDINALNALLKNLASDLKIKFVNLNEKLSDSNGNLNSKYTYDGLHTNALGFEIETNEILHMLK